MLCYVYISVGCNNCNYNFSRTDIHYTIVMSPFWHGFVMKLSFLATQQFFTSLPTLSLSSPGLSLVFSPHSAASVTSSASPPSRFPPHSQPSTLPPPLLKPLLFLSPSLRPHLSFSVSLSRSTFISQTDLISGSSLYLLPVCSQWAISLLCATP